MAFSVGATLGVASIAAAVTFAIGTIIVVLLVRRRHRRFVPPATGLARRLSAYHRANLSVDDTNYSHIPPPTTRLRRSAQLPCGVLSDGWADLPSQESLIRPPVALTREQQAIEPEFAQPKRYQSLRATFSPHSFHVPKTRRQKKMSNAIPLNVMGWSPLSAITEISDPNIHEISSVMDAVELPTEITPTTTPPSHGDMLKSARPTATQRPLRNDQKRSRDALPMTAGLGVKRNSAPMRIKSPCHGIGSRGACPGQRSISMGSIVSVAPRDPLPPLPMNLTTHYTERSKSKLRSSVASTDTVGSSVLGTSIFSASNDGTGLAGLLSDSPGIALNPSLLWEYESRPDSCGPIAVTIGTPPGTKASRGLRIAAAGIGSFRASIDNPLSKMTRPGHTAGSSQYQNLERLQGPAIVTTDVGGRDSNLSVRDNSLRKSLSPSMPTPFIWHNLAYRGGRPPARHSTYEKHTGFGKISFNPNVLQDFSADDISPLPRPSQPRPASVGTVDPPQWDQNVLSALGDADLNRPSGQQCRCHKCRTCFRLPNLPLTDTRRRAPTLPHMGEEDEPLETPTKRGSKTPGLSLIQNNDDGDNIFRRPATLEATPSPSPSPFKNKPILHPTSHAPRAVYSHASQRKSTGSPWSDSDIFSTDHYQPEAPNIFASRRPDRNWPLSATPPNNIKLNSTPSAASSIFSEPYNPESPILPSPTLLSTTLFPHKSTLYGPRDFPPGAVSGRHSRTAPPSPLQHIIHKSNVSTTATKQRRGGEMRRSATILRCMNSDRNYGSQKRASNIGRNLANKYGGGVGGGKDRSLSMVGATRSPIPVREDDNLAQMPLMAEKILAPIPTMRSGAGFRQSNGHLGIERSVSVLSTAGASIWEDASVRGDSSEPELPVREKDDEKMPRVNAMTDLDLEVFENFVNQTRNGRAGKSQLRSLQGTGLGLMGLDAKVLGTPASLYDRDGFLKD